VEVLWCSGVLGGGSKYQLCPAGYYGDGTKPCSPCLPGQYAPETGSTECRSCPANFYASEFGSSICIKCVAGTTSVEGSTFCAVQCIFLQENTGNYIDLTGLRGTIGPLGDATGLTKDAFYLDICGYVDQNICPDTPGYVCERSPSGEQFNAGRVFDASFTEQNVSLQLILSYSNGDEQGCPLNVKRRTAIAFQCISEDEPQMSKPTLSLISNQCIRTFIWKTNQACRICDSIDYERTESDCVEGFQEISEAKIPGTLCSGPPIKGLKKIQCEDIKFPLGVVIGISVGIAVVFAIVIIIIIRSRMTISRYRDLDKDTSRMGTEGDVEMEGPSMDDARL